MNRATRDKFASATLAADSSNARWETAPKLFADIALRFGPFDIDLCANAGNRLLPTWFGPGSRDPDVLTAGWSVHGKSGFGNPPYGRFIAPYLAKALHEARVHGFRSVHLLPWRQTKAMLSTLFAYDNNTEQWLTQTYICDRRIYFYEDGAPRFDDKGRPQSALFDSVILVIEPYVADRPIFRRFAVPDHVW